MATFIESVQLNNDCDRWKQSSLEQAGYYLQLLHFLSYKYLLKDGNETRY